MTHVPTAETFDLLKSYYLCPERKAFITWKNRKGTRSRKIRRAPRSVTGQLQHGGTSVSPADFGDPESHRVLTAAARTVAPGEGLQAGLSRQINRVSTRTTAVMTPDLQSFIDCVIVPALVKRFLREHGQRPDPNRPEPDL